MTPGRKRIAGTEAERASTMGFRYPAAKKDFLTKAYGSRLPELLRELTDTLIVRAITMNEVKTINK
jgi:hypothetical protein